MESVGEKMNKKFVSNWYVVGCGWGADDYAKFTHSQFFLKEKWMRDEEKVQGRKEWCVKGA